ncbi:MAG: PP2C family protein-serine/threonine phosphatase [Actinomycetota bacterium]
MQNAVPKHYLWAVGEGIKAYQPGELIAGRYLLKSGQIVQDTQPEVWPEMPEEISSAILPYLRLFPYRLHIPQLYGVVPRSASKLSAEILLLEAGPIWTRSESLMPELANAWKQAPPIRQLNWLWQLAGLWQPLNTQGVASTLLNPQLLRVEGPLLRLLELQLDRKTATLSQLAQVWQQWLPDAHPSISNFLKQLCHQMSAGELRTSEQLISQLDKALAICGRSQKRTIAIATSTDTGPTRVQNEDACYPNSNSILTVTPGAEAFAIVCDGIGGQDGGEVASELAITVLRERVEQMLLHPANWDPLTLTNKLERSACAANDAIASRNDSERRQGRQRMGTTLVMALAHIHELYITHVGDSRAYWITRSGCHQVTLDDDVASREVRLGYALYREALQQVAAGALVQALGITSSATLHPTVQRFPIDEDCVFLLCSDGLSDRDRVEECWEAEILPLLDGSVDLRQVRDRLMEVANHRNGHDNVTIAVLHVQVTPGESKIIEVPPVEALPFSSEPDGAVTHDDPIADSGTNSDLKTHLIPPQKKPPSPLPLLLKILSLIGIGGVLAYVFIPPVGRWMDVTKEWMLSKFSSTPKAAPFSPATPTPQSSSTTTNKSPIVTLAEGSLLETLSSASGNGRDPNDHLTLLSAPENTATEKGALPAGTFLQVLNRKPSVSDQGAWINVKICSLPPTPGVKVSKFNSPSPALKLLQPGDTGWLLEASANLTTVIHPTLNPIQLGKCADSTSTPPSK